MKHSQIMAVPVAICDLRQSQSQALHRPSHTRQGWGQFNSGIGIAAQFQFLFRNWNWNWNWWNWKWNWNWSPWNWNWKPELNFWQLLPQHLLVNQLFPNYSFNRVNRGHNLSCDQRYVVRMYSATSDNNVVKLTTFCFQQINYISG